MNSTSPLCQLEPTSLWLFFQQICAIPRPSRHEAEVTAFIQGLCRELGLESGIDAVGNSWVRKPASPGFENRQGVILQSHLDMVPQKNSCTDHDFINDPIRPRIIGDWVKATDTTLGADNGIGVAASLALLADKKAQHGPLEVLFTINEESGMDGAFGLQPGLLRGDLLINLDSEAEGELFVGCAGGGNVNIRLPYKPEPAADGMAIIELQLTGLKGGHSGLDINLGRGNANKLTNSFLRELAPELGVQVVSFNGGSLRNAIPREAFTRLALPENRVCALLDRVQRFEAELKQEFGNKEPDLSLIAIPKQPSTCSEGVIPVELISPLLDAVEACPNGMIAMIEGLDAVVETSSNLARIQSDGQVISLLFLVRSTRDPAKEDLSEQIQTLFEAIGAEVERQGSYPGWQPDHDSLLLQLTRTRYERLFGTQPKVTVIHAGLECGLIGAVYPKLDMISFGPTIRYPHSPDEQVHIPSVERFWRFLLEVLKAIPPRPM